MKKRTVLQSHWLLAHRLWHIVNAFPDSDKMTDEQKKAKEDFKNQAIEHERKANLFGDKFIMSL